MTGMAFSEAIFIVFSKSEDGRGESFQHSSVHGQEENAARINSSKTGLDDDFGSNVGILR